MRFPSSQLFYLAIIEGGFEVSSRKQIMFGFRSCSAQAATKEISFEMSANANLLRSGTPFPWAF